MLVKITKSPNPLKKFRVILENGDSVDFGARGYSDYTKHKNPFRMRLYVQRHGGRIPIRIIKEENPSKVHRRMLAVENSDKELWGVKGISTPGFWSRWYLWSFPNLKDAEKYMNVRFGIKFH